MDWPPKCGSVQKTWDDIENVEIMPYEKVRERDMRKDTHEHVSRKNKTPTMTSMTTKETRFDEI